MDKQTTELLIRVIRKELRQWREQIIYSDIEVFVGCVLSDLKSAGLLTSWEESVIRQKLLEEG
jgi:hypothetical protein